MSLPLLIELVEEKKKIRGLIKQTGLRAVGGAQLRFSETIKEVEVRPVWQSP